MRRHLTPRVQTGCALAVVLIACWFTLFNGLGTSPMQVWDEIRLANNAIEMVETGDLIVTRYDGQPETWNTKPPLQIWLEALSVKLLGIQDVAFRLPSALAALATVLVLFLFARRQLDGVWAATLAALLLVSSPGLVLIHAARNGEYDALLVLWMFAAALAFFTFVWRPAEQKWLWLTALFVVLAVYTKGVQGLLILPGLIVYAAAAGKFRAVFGQRKVYVAASLALLVIGAYYMAREQLQPGYLRAVWDNELFGRFAAANEGHNEGLFAYLAVMRWWTVILLLALPALFYMKGTDRRIGVFAITVPMSYLVVISLSKSKLEWYVAPVYPFLSLYVVVALRTLIAMLRARVAWAGPAVIALACGATLWAVSAMAIRADRGDHPLTTVQRYPEQRYPQQLAAFRDALPDPPGHVILVTPGYQAPALYYQKYFAERGLRFELQSLDRLDLHPGDTILTSVDAIKSKVREDYDTKRVFSYEGMEGYVVG